MQAAYHRHREQPPSVQDFADAPAGAEDRLQVAAREAALLHLVLDGRVGAGRGDGAALGFVGLNERHQNV